MTSVQDSNLKIYGIMVCRNEGAKALRNILYHTQHQNFAGFFVVDHGSTDDTAKLIQQADLPNTIIFDRGNEGYFQDKWGDEVHQYIRDNNIQCDALVPVDCDTMWRLDHDKLIEYVQSELDGIMGKVYGFWVHQAIEDMQDKHDYMDNYWKYLKYRNTTLQNPNLHLHQGDHAFNGAGSFEITYSQLAYEYNVLSYEDWMRKVVQAAMGNIARWGMDWLNGKIGCATQYIAVFNHITETGELKDNWKSKVLSEEVAKREVEEGKMVVDTSMFGIEIR
jgi:hypothetical protein